MHVLLVFIYIPLCRRILCDYNMFQYVKLDVLWSDLCLVSTTRSHRSFSSPKTFSVNTFYVFHSFVFCSLAALVFKRQMHSLSVFRCHISVTFSSFSLS